MTVPAPLRESLRLMPGATVIFQHNDSGEVRLLAEQPSRSEVDPLLRLPSIAAEARLRASPAEVNADPIGDYLVAEDERTKSRP